MVGGKYMVHMDTPAMIGWIVNGRVHQNPSARKGHPSYYYFGLGQLKPKVPMRFELRPRVEVTPKHGKYHLLNDRLSITNYAFRITNFKFITITLKLNILFVASHYYGMWGQTIDKATNALILSTIHPMMLSCQKED